MRISDWSSDVCSSDLVLFSIGQSIILYELVNHSPASRPTSQMGRGTKTWWTIAQLHEILTRHAGRREISVMIFSLRRLGGTKTCQIGRASRRERVCTYV